VQDLPETDLLLARDYAAHEGGFAAAMKALGRPAPALYHLDATRPETPRVRTLAEEIARVVRARASNPRWAQGMMRHGFRGAAEITATIDNLAAFAQLTGQVPAHLFDLCFDATLGQSDIVAFMDEANPAALEQLRARFAALAEAGLGHAAQLHRRSTGGSAMNAPYDPLVKGWCPEPCAPCSRAMGWW
jgi:cobaltochelatase CobN